MNFYPRPPRGGRQTSLLLIWSALTISIHALREEGDTVCRGSQTLSRNFYPRPPRGGRHLWTTRCNLCGKISIHALREEGDRIRRWDSITQNYFYPRPPRGGRRRVCRSRTVQTNFYPRPPRGGRPVLHLSNAKALIFLSTPSARRATYTPINRKEKIMISIHALREEGDRWPRLPTTASGYFYPRPPRGGRRQSEIHE